MPESKREQIWDMIWKDREFAKSVLEKDSIILRFREPRGITRGNPYTLEGDNGVDDLKLEMKEWEYKL